MSHIKTTIINGSDELIQLDARIFMDDTIYAAKQKIAMHPSLNMSPDEIHLFTTRSTLHNVDGLYDQMTQNGKTDLSRELVMGLAHNLNKDVAFGQSPVSYKDISDLLEISGHNNEVELDTDSVVGKSITGTIFKKSYVVNPFRALKMMNESNSNVKSLWKHLPTIVRDAESSTILEFCKPNDTLYIGLARDVINNQNEPIELIIRIYYPQLFKLKITNSVQFDQLIPEIRTKFMNDNPQLKQKHNSVADLIEFMHGAADGTKFRKQGIVQMNATTRQTQFIKVPIDQLFRISHATESGPKS
jgi:hypothetical protein